MKTEMNKQDGVVTFFNSKKFELQKRMFLNMFLQNNNNYNFSDVLSKEMYYPSMALFLLLKKTEGSDKDTQVLVVNTHLLFNKNRGHVKFGMIVLMLKAIESIKQQYGIKNVFVCGDFNLIPNSLLYEYINTGKIDFDCELKQYSNQVYIMNQKKGKSLVDIIKMADKKFKPFKTKKDDIVNKAFLEQLASTEIILPKGQEEEINVRRHIEVPKMNLNDLEHFYTTLSHKVGLNSSYSVFNNTYIHKNKNSQELDNINFTFDRNTNNNDCFVSQFAQDLIVPVDYIWYSVGQNYEPVGVLQTPDPEYLNCMPDFCPIDNFGSDHFSIAVDFISK